MISSRFPFLVAVTMSFGFPALAQYSTPVRDVENPAHFPYIAANILQLSNGQSSRFVQTLGTVPAGKRVVLEYINVGCYVPSGQTINEFELGVPVPPSVSPGGSVPIRIPLSSQGEAYGTVGFVASLPLKIYVQGPSSSITYGASRSGSAGAAWCYVTIFGYTVTL